jgi:hypothetical protein
MLLLFYIKIDLFNYKGTSIHAEMEEMDFLQQLPEVTKSCHLYLDF